MKPSSVYLQYILNWPLPIEAFQSEWNTTTIVKNPDWLEANHLAIYKYIREIEPGTTRNKFNEWSEWVLNPWTSDLKASVLTTGPHCLSTVITHKVPHKQQIKQK